MLNRKFLAIILISFSFLIPWTSAVQAAGLCESCAITADCDSDLVCVEGKCRVECSGDQICIENPLSACDFNDLVNSVINFIFYISLGIAPLMVIVAGIYLVTAGGNPDNVQKAKDIILYTFIGLLIIFLARALIAVVKAALGG